LKYPSQEEAYLLPVLDQLLMDVGVFLTNLEKETGIPLVTTNEE
jgi:hypothetical protein